MGRKKTNIGKCKVSDCDKDATVAGMCLMHYTRAYRHGDVHVVKKIDKYENDICAIEGCNEKVYAKYLCSKHYDNDYRQRNRC